ncbi:Chaperone protein DnaJ [uncultured archaeon]|nr:Chaperone protein DnaJ [uncultured archaeon]
MKNYYAVLGLEKGANEEQIKKAYRRLALLYHPDRNRDADAEEKFKEISEAYAVLSDDQKRAQYDQYGHAGFDQRYSQEDIFRNANFADFEDIFGGMGFGSDPFDLFGFGSRGPRRGADLQATVEITLEEAAKGVKREFEFAKMKKCSTCRGSGGAPGAGIRTCPQCGGAGRVRITRRLGPMHFQTIEACNRCGGAGRRYDRACPDCGGSGMKRQKEKITIDIPPGAFDNMRMKFEEGGEYSAAGYGDLYVDVHVKRHQLFEREGDDLITELSIPFTVATLGRETEVQTLLSGKKKINVPAGTQPDDVITVRGEGVPRLQRGGKGDLLIRVKVGIPKKINKKQKELLEEFEKEGKKPFGLF